MNLIRLTFLLLSTFVLSTCIDEDLSSCYDCNKTNLLLDFIYVDEEGEDLFGDNIQSVDVFVYDSNDFFVKQLHVTKKDLSVYAGTELNLKPDTYRIVCWANAAEKTSLYKPAMGRRFEDAFLLYNYPIEDNLSSGGDSLYYAPFNDEGSSSQTFTITVPEKDIQKAAINFRSAHITIEVYVKGFVDTSPKGQLLQPYVELTKNAARYNFDLQTFDHSVTYRGIAISQTIDEDPVSVIKFTTPLFAADTPAEVFIKKQSDGNIETTVSLKDFISDNHIDITKTTPVVIPIWVEHKNASVEITMHNWDNLPVKPEL